MDPEIPVCTLIPGLFMTPSGMPKPVKNRTPKSSKRPQAEHSEKVLATQAPWQGEGMVPPVLPFAEQLSAHMRALGAKGGKVSGAKRMQMPEAKRKAIAKKGAAARWAKKPSSTDG